LLVLLLALILGRLGFAIHVLWWIALVVLAIWLLGFLVRMGEGGSRGALVPLVAPGRGRKCPPRSDLQALSDSELLARLHNALRGSADRDTVCGARGSVVESIFVVEEAGRMGDELE
jgi:hypothetical protein